MSVTAETAGGLVDIPKGPGGLSDTVGEAGGGEGGVSRVIVYP